MVALRPISVGEEVTYDYAMSEADCPFDVLECGCLCGTKLCRKNVLPGDWKRPEVGRELVSCFFDTFKLQQRYAGHFLPFIEKRIAELQLSNKVDLEKSNSSVSL
eukprot:TRINITY_DN712_c0_g1_i1.p1 TRINITY_DN712_c0_g1~~TRINITY_DN712_c0_g1_i1.p1  ORF type:complete len:105 (+),score=18.73 TRINITY_DN712_c0_g1_i1:584-898(+)